LGGKRDDKGLNDLSADDGKHIANHIGTVGDHPGDAGHQNNVVLDVSGS
jgi:hypothetical protein